MAFSRTLKSLIIALAGVSAAASAGAQSNSAIENTARLDVRTVSGTPRTVTSNTTRLNVQTQLYTSKLRFYRMPKTFDYSDLSCVDIANRVVHGAFISAATLATMSEDDDKTDQTTAMVLEYANGNKDPERIETQTIDVALSTGLTGKFIVTETGPNTGVFAGGVSTTAKTSNARACIPHFPKNARLIISFNGGVDTLPTSDTILIDPFGEVFDSRTGALVNGATITLIDDATGLPAKVFADDGVTPYPSTVVSGSTVTDSGGNTYTFDDGEYRFPLTYAGRYRLKVAPPSGYVAPSIVAPADIPQGDTDFYTVVEASYGRSFDLTSPEPLEVDIPIDPIPAGTPNLQKTASRRDAEPGDFISYQLRVTNPDAWTMRAVNITDNLPVGLRYKAGTARGAPEPTISSDGRTLVFTVGNLATNGVAEVTYLAEVLPNARPGEAVNRAQVWIPGSAPSPEAIASVRIKPLLNSAALTIVGRVTEGDCRIPAEQRKGVAGVRILLDDGTYVTTDRDGLYHIEGARKGRHVVQLDVNTLARHLIPDTCEDDTRWAGSDISRFVEGQGGSLIRVDFRLRNNGKKVDETDLSLPIKVADDAVASGGRTNWFMGQAPGIEFLFPDVDHNPRAPALRVAIKHFPTQRVALTLNGAPVDALTFDGADRDGEVAVSVWTGLSLKDGDNLLEARVLDEKGAVVKTLSRTVHYANTPVKATFVPEHSRLIADGVSKPLIAVRLTDRDGKPVRAGTMVPFVIDQPYMAAQTAEAEQNRQLSGLDRALPTAQVIGDDGLAFLALQPTLQAGAAHVVINFQQDGVTQKSEMRPWLKAGQQKWVVVGFGAGTVGFDTLSSKAEAYAADGDGTMTDGQVSFYAKGRIKGEWLLTMAYDSEREFDARTGLLSVIDPDQYYTVYGDGTQQAYDAASQRKLYLRLERREYYALFGDFETAMTDTQLTRFSRTLNGLKTEYHSDNHSVKAFAARSDQRYARDEIRGNGLSGPYRLSAGGIIANTDKITLETRDRLRPEKILDSRLLTRHIDYDIDAEAGTLRFREPVMAQDFDRNPIFIVADYEVEGEGDQRLVAGVRATTKLADGKVELGASYIHDEADSNAAVTGLDLKARLSDSTELRAEVARGGREDAAEAGAWLVEIEHHSAKADVLAYARRQDNGFGVGQQNRGENGTLRHGIDGQVRLSDKLRLTGALWRQATTDDTQTRVSGNARLEYRRANGTVFAGLEGASDTGFDTANPDARQVSRFLTLGGSQSLMKDKLQLNGQVQMALGGDKAAADFPLRHQLSAAYKVMDGIRLIAGHEIADGAGVKAHNTQLGFEVAPWTGAKASTTLNQQAIGENGARTFAQLGLNQSLPLSKRWTVDATFDASQTVSGQVSGTTINPFRPVTTNRDGDSGDGDYMSVTLGATYRATDWSWTGRIERLTSDTSNRWGVTSNALRSLGQGKTVASGLRAYEVVRSDGRNTRFAAADLAVAWRPLDSRWSVLERLELRHESASAGVGRDNVLAVTAGSVPQQTTRVVNNLAVNYSQFARTTEDDNRANGYEISAYYGAKYVKGRFAGEDYDGFIDLIGIEGRHDLGERFDIGFNLAVRHAWDSGAVQYTYGPSLGFTPAKNVWLTAGYNIAGFHDRDFDDSRYTRQGAYVTARFKFDQTTFADAAQRLRKKQ